MLEPRPGLDWRQGPLLHRPAESVPGALMPKRPQPVAPIRESPQLPVIKGSLQPLLRALAALPAL